MAEDFDVIKSIVSMHLRTEIVEKPQGHLYANGGEVLRIEITN